VGQPPAMGAVGPAGSPKRGLRCFSGRVSVQHPSYAARAAANGRRAAAGVFSAASAINCAVCCHAATRRSRAVQGAGRPEVSDPHVCEVTAAAAYGGPYLVHKKADEFFILKIGNRFDAISMDRLKPHLGSSPPVAASPPTRGRPAKKNI
jgi:hypothetical protein